MTEHMFNHRAAWSGRLPHRSPIIESDFTTIHPAVTKLQKETMWHQ